MTFKVDPTPLGPFTKGVNTRLPDSALTDKQLRNGVNVDIDDTGRVHRRKGATKVIAGTSVRSVWADGDAGPVYYADGTQLRRFTPDGAPPHDNILVATITAGATVVFERYLSDIFWTDGVLTGRIVDGTNQSWGLATPPAAGVVLNAVAGGSLFDGQYQATYTYLRANGEESGAPLTNSVEIANPRNANGKAALLVTGIIASPDNTVIGINLYCTGANGAEPFQVAFLPNAPAIARITEIDSVAGKSLTTQFYQPAPPGTQLVSLGPRLYVASGRFLFYSEPFAPAWFSPGYGYIPFADDIAVVLAVNDGLYVATTTETYFLDGMDPLEMKLVRVLPYGAMRNSGAQIRNGVKVAWMGRHGVVIAEPNGVVKAVQEEEVAVELATRGVTGYREVNGMRQIVSILLDAAPSPRANKEYTAMEARRLATVLPTE